MTAIDHATIHERAWLIVNSTQIRDGNDLLALKERCVKLIENAGIGRDQNEIVSAIIARIRSGQDNLADVAMRPGETHVIMTNLQVPE